MVRFMKKFLVKIWAYDHYSKFEVESEDNANSLEQAVLDKLGENVIVWEKTGMFGPLNRITYEEVINDTRPIQSKKVLGVEVGTGASV
jgi:streptogramin lyase